MLIPCQSCCVFGDSKLSTSFQSSCAPVLVSLLCLGVDIVLCFERFFPHLLFILPGVFSICFRKKTNPNSFRCYRFTFQSFNHPVLTTGSSHVLSMGDRSVLTHKFVLRRCNYSSRMDAGRKFGIRNALFFPTFSES